MISLNYTALINCKIKIKINKIKHWSKIYSGVIA